VAPDPDVARRLAAAYIIDSPTPLDLLAGPLSTIPVCTDPSEIRCLVGWVAVRPQETARIEALTQRSRALDARGRLSAVEDRGYYASILFSGRQMKITRLHVCTGALQLQKACR
jgi:hypothetical protein